MLHSMQKVDKLNMIINNLLMLNVGYASHNGDWNYENVNSPFTRIYYVTKGEAKVKIGDETHALTPGHLYIIPTFTEHSDICTGLFEHYYVHFYEEGTSGKTITDTMEFPFEIEATSMDLILFQNLCEHNQAMRLRYSDPKLYDNKTSLIDCTNFNRKRPIYDRMESMGILFQLFGKFVKAGRPKFQTKDERIGGALDYIEQHYTEIGNIKELADKLYMSCDHLIRLFKHEVGVTPMQFIINKKMTAARMMIASESMPIKEIAYTLGYDDISYFNRIFKQHTHCTPSQYRRMFNVSQNLGEADGLKVTVEKV